jgi:hypothetical protein
LKLKDAERLGGAAVMVRFTVAAPAYTWSEGKKVRTIVGPADRNNGAEWSVVLKGNRLHDTDDGAKLTVTGRLKVIRHPPATAGTRTFNGFTEVRIEEP